MTASLGDRLRARIARDGPLAFSEFVAAALYDRDAGFYAIGTRLGRGGAFATAPTLHPAFAQAVASEWSRVVADVPAAGDLLEYGPGDGALAVALSRLVPAARRLFVEPAYGMQALQQAVVDGAWFTDPDDVPPIRGLVVMNEVLDALPFDLLAWPDEVRVGVDQAGRFVECVVPYDGPPPCTAPRRGGRYAVRPNLAPAVARMLRPLEHGRALIIDYGGDPDVIHDGRRDPVRTFVGGRRGGAAISAPGRQDITADVDYAAVREGVRAAGLTVVRELSQAAWLREHGAGIRTGAEFADDNPRLALLLDELWSFRVLVAERLPCPASDVGLQEPARRASGTQR